VPLLVALLIPHSGKKKEMSGYSECMSGYTEATRPLFRLSIGAVSRLQG
jgi:hypothetical protein